MEIKNLNQNNILRNIKSKYILSKLIHFLPFDKFLSIIKYNKEIQKRLDIKKMIMKNMQK